MSRQQDFQQKMARMNAKAQSSGKRVSTYDPYASPKDLRPSIFKQLFVLVFSMVVVTAARAAVFHKPEWFQFVFDRGIGIGVFANWYFPITASIVVSALAGHNKNGLWFPSLLGFLVMLWGEDMYIIQQVPQIFEMVYSPDYVAFVDQGGDLQLWMDGDRGGVLPAPAVEGSDLGALVDNLINTVSGEGEQN